MPIDNRSGGAIGIFRDEDQTLYERVAGYAGGVEASHRCRGRDSGFAFLGDPRILRGRSIGFFCSVRCPGDPILKTYDLARALRDTYLTIVGGFQSPMEKELPAPAVAGILRGLFVCPARGFGRMRILKMWNPLHWMMAASRFCPFSMIKYIVPR